MNVFYKRIRRCANLNNRIDIILKDIYHVLEIMTEKK
jgi:hypothetical protein